MRKCEIVWESIRKCEKVEESGRKQGQYTKVYMKIWNMKVFDGIKKVFESIWKNLKVLESI